MSRIKPEKKTRPAIKNWCFKAEVSTSTPCPVGFEDDGSGCQPIRQPCPPGMVRDDQSGDCKPITSGKTLLEQVVFFGFSSNPTGDVTTTLLIGNDNVPGDVPECTFTKRITDSDVDTVGSVTRVNLEGTEDLGSYRDNQKCYQVPLYFNKPGFKIHVLQSYGKVLVSSNS